MVSPGGVPPRWKKDGVGRQLPPSGRRTRRFAERRTNSDRSAVLTGRIGRVMRSWLVSAWLPGVLAAHPVGAGAWPAAGGWTGGMGWGRPTGCADEAGRLGHVLLVRGVPLVPRRGCRAGWWRTSRDGPAKVPVGRARAATSRGPRHGQSACQRSCWPCGSPRRTGVGGRGGGAGGHRRWHLGTRPDRRGVSRWHGALRQAPMQTRSCPRRSEERRPPVAGPLGGGARCRLHDCTHPARWLSPRHRGRGRGRMVAGRRWSRRAGCAARGR